MTDKEIISEAIKAQADLTEEERELLEESRAYLKQKEIKQTAE